MEPVLLTKQDLISKLVQEIAKKGDKVPEAYLHKNGFPEAIDAPGLWREDLLIDCSLLSSSSTSELEKLLSSLSQWGCFQVINHGIEISFLEELIEVTRQIFELPLEEKLDCFSLDDPVQGYGSDSSLAGGQTSSWNDRVFLSLHPKGKKPECWPQKPEKFREMVDEYSEKLKAVNKVICKAMANSLNLEENYFKFGEQGPGLARFTLYPSCPCPKQVLGSKPHSDGTIITYLLPDKGVQSLQILKDDQWYNVSVISGALFINIGYLGEILTNGMFKSRVHRVITNSEKDRISVALFIIPEIMDGEFGPLSELVSAHQPQVYKKFNISEYWQKFRQNFDLGSRTHDAFRV